MQLQVENFGGIRAIEALPLVSRTLPNGHGKTTMVNAYLFALTGKTLNGFQARNIYAPADELTTVKLLGFLNLAVIRRTTDGNGTTLYVGGDVVTQADFNAALANDGYDLDFITACANANVLTSNDLDAETLRKILAKADVLDNEEYDAVKKELSALRKKLKAAELAALTSVLIPQRSCQPITEAERVFATGYKKAKIILNDGVTTTCPFCNATHDKAKIAALQKMFDEAKIIVEEGLNEFSRIMIKQSDYDKEAQDIEDAKRLSDAARIARNNVISLKKEVASYQEELNRIDAERIVANLPDGVSIITEIMQKNGTTKPTCTLEYNRIPLRSINHAKRIEICVAILDNARTNKGMDRVPIIIDNADAFDDQGTLARIEATYKNTILLSAR